MKNKYTFIRHGETSWNKSGIMHGQYDIPLNENGLKQAKSLENELTCETYDICFCSPLQRAKQTALIILRKKRNVAIIYDDRLKELSKGKLEGKHFNSEKLLKIENKGFLEKYQIESKSDFFNRVGSLIKEIECNYSNKNILIVAHSGTVKMGFFYFNYPNKKLAEAYYNLSIKNCKAYKIDSQTSLDKKMKIGFFPMVADILHAGHILALEEAKKKCDYLIVGLHCFPDYKTPQQSIYERYVQLRGVKFVDEILPYENINKDTNIFLSLDYDIYFLGNDHKGAPWELKEMIEGLGKEIFYISRKHNYSSTKIKNEAPRNASK